MDILIELLLWIAIDFLIEPLRFRTLSFGLDVLRVDASVCCNTLVFKQLRLCVVEFIAMSTTKLIFIGFITGGLD